MAALVRRWIEAGLAGALDPTGSAAPAGTDLADRLAAVEAALAQLQTAPPSPGTGDHPPAKATAAKGPPPAGALESAALAKKLGIKRGTFNASVARSGGAREGLQLHGWRCVGLRTPDQGGPPRALWVQS